jgi:hypothetical protein
MSLVDAAPQDAPDPHIFPHTSLYVLTCPAPAPQDAEDPHHLVTQQAIVVTYRHDHVTGRALITYLA